MAPPKLTLLVDIISPFGYMAFHVLENDPTFKGVDIEYVPMFLGGVMQDTGNRPPLAIKNKAQYIARQRVYWEKRFNVPFADKMPEPFPQPTIQTGRALCAIKAKYPAKLNAAIAALYKAFFIELKAVGKPDAIIATLTPVLSKAELEDVMNMSQQAEIKQKLLDNTKYSLEEGCFGLPYFIATNSKGEKETFWGVDHLGQVIEHLGLKPQGDGFRSML